MEILYKNFKVEQSFSAQYSKKWKYPKQVQIKLHSIRNFIEQAQSLNDICRMPMYRFHHLQGSRKHEWSISVGNTGYRITIIPCDQDGKELIDGDILSQCKQIKVIQITEVSNHYE